MLRCVFLRKSANEVLSRLRYFSSDRAPAKYTEAIKVDSARTNESLNDVVESVAVPVTSPPTIDITSRGKIVSIPHKDESKKVVSKDLWIPSPTAEPDRQLSYYKKLAKFRLTSLVVITAMGGYAMAPASFDLTTFAMCSLGTGLVSAAANAINQYHEVPFDSQMSRTKNRVLVLGQITPLHAIGFAIFSASVGLGILYYGVNGLTAALGAGNLLLYTSVYTPMKRISILNTWVGSVVGAIPPLMGWAGCAGDLGAGAWILAALLYAWQFPHFNALSWNLRPDYSRAGYRMMSVTNPSLCRRVALKYTVAISGLSLLAPALDVTNIWFAVETIPLNAYFIYLAYNFYKKSDSGSSRKLFRFSLIHLPALMLLLIFNKKRWIFMEESSKEKIKDGIILQTAFTDKNRNVLPIAIAASTKKGSCDKC